MFKKKYKNIALILAAGRGNRFDCNIPKQFYKLNNLTILEWTIKAFANHEQIDAIKVIINQDDINLYNLISQKFKLLPFSLGGKSRQESTFIGLKSLEEFAPKNVLIHDACRPFVSKKIISETIDNLIKNVQIVIPVVKVNNTLKKIVENNIQTLNRENLFYAQTPQAIIYKNYRKYYENEIKSATDDASIFENYGANIKVIEGDLENIKITNQNDLKIAKKIMLNKVKTRVGIGFDAHRFDVEQGDNFIWLGGVKVKSEYKVLAHSDGDVLIHAIVDALLGAISAGDIGIHFPPSDEKWKNASSDKFLKFAVDLIRDYSGNIVNIDSTVICQTPKIMPYRDEIIEKLSYIIGIDKQYISLKATTTEKMGFTGRNEGIAVQAIAAVEIGQ